MDITMPRKAMKSRRPRRKGPSKRAKARKNEDTFSLVCRSTATSVPVQGGSVANYVYIAAQLINPTSPNSVLNNAEYRLFNTIYDQVRINKVVLKITPKANFLSQDQAQNDALNVYGDGLVHHVVDRNSIPAANTDVFKKYSSYSKTSVLKPMTRSYSVKYPDGVWLDCRSETVDETLLRRLGLLGGVFVYAENLLEDYLEVFNEPWAGIEWEYHCVFRGKGVPQLTFDNDGTITMTPPELLPAAVPSTLADIRGGTYTTGGTDMVIAYQNDGGGGDMKVQLDEGVNPINFTPVAPP